MRLKQELLRIRRGVGDVDAALSRARRVRALRRKLRVIAEKVISLNDSIEGLSDDHIMTLIELSDLMYALISFTLTVSVTDEGKALRRLEMMIAGEPGPRRDGPLMVIRRDRRELKLTVNTLERALKELEGRVNVWMARLSDEARDRIREKLALSPHV